MSVSKVEGEQFRLPRGGFVLMLALYLIGILVGFVFVALWLTGTAEIGLGLAGIGIAAFCGYLVPTAIGPAMLGDSLVIGPAAFQYVRAGTKVLGNIPFANVEAITINERDGGNSLWIRLKDPAAEATFWIGGLETMNVIESQCGYHLVVGQGLQIRPPELQAKFNERLGGAA